MIVLHQEERTKMESLSLLNWSYNKSSQDLVGVPLSIHLRQVLLALLLQRVVHGWNADRIIRHRIDLGSFWTPERPDGIRHPCQRSRSVRMVRQSFKYTYDDDTRSNISPMHLHRFFITSSVARYQDYFFQFLASSS